MLDLITGASSLNYLVAFFVGMAVLTFGLGGGRQLSQDLSLIFRYCKRRLGRRSTSVLGINNISLQTNAMLTIATAQVSNFGLENEGLRSQSWLRRRLNRSGYDKITTFEFIIAVTGLTLISLAIFSLIFSFLLALLAATIILAGIFAFLQEQEERLQDKYDEGLKDALLQLVRLVKGKDLETAFEIVAEDMPEPLGKHFRELVTALNAKVPLIEALIDMRDHVGSPGVALMVDAVAAYRLGGASNLPGLFRDLADKLQEATEFKREARTDFKMAIWVTRIVSFLPFGFLLLYRISVESIFDNFIGSIIGQVMIAFSGVYLLGINYFVQTRQRMKGIL